MLGDISKISQEAKKQLANDPSVLDATSGVFHDEEGIIGYSKTFDTLSKSLSPKEKYAYCGVTGGNDFQSNVMKWIFGNHLPKPFFGVCATMGATGAISNALDLYGKKGTTILLPNLFWHNYLLMSQVHEFNIKTYSMFVDGKFNSQEFLENCKHIIEKQGSLLTIINAPAHNPSGYNLSKEELVTIISKLKDISKDKPVIIIYDIAYLDLAKEKSHLDVFDTIPSNFKIILAYSFSKSLGLYGLRLGTAILLSKNQEEVTKFLEQSYLLSRTKWSSPNQEAITVFNKIMGSKVKQEQAEKEISKMKDVLKIRSTFLLEELKKLNIPFYPYQNGFFITLKTDDNESLYNRFKKEKVYTIPVTNGIRIAIACLDLKKLQILVERMKKIF